jgi:DNA-binding transcriptional LysR family regulator
LAGHGDVPEIAMPMPAQPSWDLYRSFLAVMQRGSLSGAARALGLSQPTVGRHIAELQEMLGGRPLFTRSSSGLLPTAAAHELRHPAEAMSSAAASILRAGGGDEVRVKGIVRVTASEIVGVEVLPPILARLRTAHPHIDIELELSNAVTDLLRRDADVAIRMVRPKQESLLARRVGRIQVGLHAHRRYVDAHGMPASIDDLAQHTIIGFDRPPPYIGSLKLGVALTRDRFAFRADSDLAQLAAIRAGFGIGFCQYGLALRDPSLIAVLPGVLQFDLDTYVVMHADQRKARHIKLAFDAIHRGMSDYASASARNHP